MFDHEWRDREIDRAETEGGMDVKVEMIIAAEKDAAIRVTLSVCVLNSHIWMVVNGRSDCFESVQPNLRHTDG